MFYEVFLLIIKCINVANCVSFKYNCLKMMVLFCEHESNMACLHLDVLLLSFLMIKVIFLNPKLQFDLNEWSKSSFSFVVFICNASSNFPCQAITISLLGKVMVRFINFVYHLDEENELYHDIRLG